MSSPDDAEIDKLLEAIYQKYGHDFREYSRASIRRRVMNAFMNSRCVNLEEMRERAVSDPSFFFQLVSGISVNVTEMFRDPLVYAAFREKVVPFLKTYPSIRIWHAGCATGEEVYSMAILLEEEGLYDRSFLYATDINLKALETARAGIYPAEQIRAYTANYHKSGGKGSFADYYSVTPQNEVQIKPELKRNILFTSHSLAVDHVFAEVHVVFCRNVMIYFTRTLQDRAGLLFLDSLVQSGFLVLGLKETIDFSAIESSFSTVDKPLRIYRKK